MSLTLLEAVATTEVAATLYSLLETAKPQGVDPLRISETLPSPADSLGLLRFVNTGQREEFSARYIAAPETQGAITLLG